MTRLVLRSTEELVRAYVLSALAGIATLWLIFAVIMLGIGASGFIADLAVIPLFLIFGCLYCMVIDLLVVAPLVAGFRRFGWRWVNSWTVAVIGFLTGTLPIALLGAASGSPRGLVANLAELAPIAGAFGIAGTAAAMTFFLNAMMPAGEASDMTKPVDAFKAAVEERAPSGGRASAVF